MYMWAWRCVYVYILFIYSYTYTHSPSHAHSHTHLHVHSYTHIWLIKLINCAILVCNIHTNFLSAFSFLEWYDQILQYNCGFIIVPCNSLEFFLYGLQGDMVRCIYNQYIYLSVLHCSSFVSKIALFLLITF